MGLESEGRKRVLTLKTKPKYLGFAATPDQMGWVNEKVRLTPYVVVVQTPFIVPYNDQY